MERILWFPVQLSVVTMALSCIVSEMQRVTVGLMLVNLGDLFEFRSVV